MTEDRPISTRTLAAALVALTLVVGVAAHAYGRSIREPAPPVETVEATLVHDTRTRITEDDPRWNCATMGNRRCGPGNRHPRTGERIAAGRYRPVPDALAGVRVERRDGSRTFRVTRACVWRPAGTTTIVCTRRGVARS